MMNCRVTVVLWVLCCSPYVVKLDTQDHGIARGEIPRVVMTDSCIEHRSKYYTVKSSIELSLTNDLDGVEKNCAVTFTTGNSDLQLLLTLVKMNIAPEDKWEIFDSTTNLNPFKKSGSFNSYEASENSAQAPNVQLVLDYKSRGEALTFSYQGTPTEKYSGFTAIVTIIRKPYLNNTCPPDFFLCRGGCDICVAEDLQCNGYKNCGSEDPSDEEDCIRLPDHTGYQDNPNRPSNAQNIGILVGGTASIVVLMVIVLVLLGIVCLRRMARQTNYAREIRTPGDDIVIDADHVPPPPLCCRRHYPCPMHSNTFAEPPPPYSEHQQHRSAGQFDAPPYTPDGCDTAGLLNQSQGLSQDTPPAYRTLPPDFSVAMGATQQPQQQNTASDQCVPPVGDIINLGSDMCDASTVTDLTSSIVVITGGSSLVPVTGTNEMQECPPLNNYHPPQQPPTTISTTADTSTKAEGQQQLSSAVSCGQDLIMDSFEPTNPATTTTTTSTTEEEDTNDGNGGETEGRQTSAHFWRNPNTTPPFKRQ